MTETKSYKLTPSDLTFLYSGCKHCFALKVKHGIRQPSIPIPGIFSTIASLQKDLYSDKRTEEFCNEIPPGIVKYGERWIQSDIISFANTPSTCFIKGRFDIVIELDDGTYIVGDFKTGRSNIVKNEMYGRQLHAYSYSLENPGNGGLALSPVTTLGLFYFTPDSATLTGTENFRQQLEGDLTWIEVKQNMNNYISFLEEVVILLDGDLPTPDPENCDWCNIRKIKGGLSEIDTLDISFENTVPKCPKCSDLMILRSGKFGEFWGCKNYPECNGTKQI
jgi:hypothetical protein